MHLRKSISIFTGLLVLAACDEPATEPGAETSGSTTAATAAASKPRAEPVELAPGLSMRILAEGAGESAEAGQIAVVHYTGWLYEESAENHRGKKFDSSVDRDQYFSFMLGAKKVIRGWDEGVVGMQVGETRELTIAPDMAYGDRGAGNVIPPGATLVFEIQLVALQGTE
jgi:FKBP-type peptidyl-prolyl cis-trans isomerase FkpA